MELRQCAMLEVWQLLASQNGADRDVIDRWGRELVVRYAEPHRRYHTIEHIRDLLPLVRGDDAKFAVWFHDAIYETARHDNEERSAELACAALRELRFDSRRVERMIRATAHHNPAGLNDDGRLFLDADLSILGTPPKRYGIYAQQIREEYAWVPDQLYRSERAKLLTSFLARTRIYFTEELFARFERQARENIAEEIRVLSAAPRKS